ncbi:hypothetical protein H0E87_020016 [Populus deltoides]|uniref:Uncharacterized protein n=1 Tax=Populus deltoides TaxID=3696 RepID=A0A8T2XXH8_POPDE|nr:hypothetical protein H0E87_020016 [Populus deltoides]
MNEEHLKEKTWLQPEPVSDGVKFPGGPSEDYSFAFLPGHSSSCRTFLKATTRQPRPEEETTATDEAPIRPNLSVGEEGGQGKSTTSQFSEKATTQPNPREGIEEPASIKIEKKPLYRKILRPHKKEEEEVINENQTWKIPKL